MKKTCAMTAALVDVCVSLVFLTSVDFRWSAFGFVGSSCFGVKGQTLVLRHS